MFLYESIALEILYFSLKLILKKKVWEKSSNFVKLLEKSKNRTLFCFFLCRLFMQVSPQHGIIRATRKILTAAQLVASSVCLHLLSEKCLPIFTSSHHKSMKFFPNISKLGVKKTKEKNIWYFYKFENISNG